MQQVFPSVLIAVLVVSQTARAVKPSIRLGAVFREHTDEHLINAFICANDWLRAQSIEKAYHFSWELRKLKDGDVNNALRSVCQLVEDHHAVAIFGPSDHAISRQLEAITEKLDVPYMKVVDDHHPMFNQRMSTTNMHPSSHIIQAYKDLIKHWKWKNVVLIYKEERRIVQLASFFEDEKLKNVHFSLIKVDDDDFLAAAKRMALAEQCSVSKYSTGKSKCSPKGFSRVLLDLAPDDAHKFLMAALKVGLIQLKHWYLFTSLDLLELDMDMFRHNHARFIGLSMYDNRTITPDMRCVQQAKHAWYKRHPNAVYFPMAETMLMIDAVMQVSSAVKALEQQHSVIDLFGDDEDETQKTSCGLVDQKSRPLSNGKALIKQIQGMEGRDALSGKVMFQTAGERSNVSFNINLLGFQGTFDRIGYWESSSVVNVSLNRDTADQLQHNLVVTNELKPHMRVTTIQDQNKDLRMQERPYVMKKRNHYEYEGNEKFEGFCVDLLAKLADDLGFTYSIHEVGDEQYGGLNETTGEWNGMIGEILKGDREMAVAPLTVNYHRAEVVDFTKPFLSLGISILYRIPDDHKPNMFSFLNPLSKEIWLWIIVAAVSVTMSMFVIARLTPFEWNPTVAYDSDRPPPRGLINNAATAVIRAGDKGPLIELTNNYSFFNTLWYVTSTLLKGGCDFGPRAVSTRLLGGVWWVFTLIITSAYTANLAAVLTVDRRYIPIKSLEDLANQTVIKYGALDGGSTSVFFKESKIETHKRMWRQIQKWQEEGLNVQTSGNADGVQKVVRSNYAYLMESASLEYEVQQNCNLTQVGGVLGSKGYGIALTKHSEWTDRISRQILDYAERGIIEQDKTKWWRSKGGTCTGTASTLKENRLSLNMENVSGLFVVLLTGLALAVFCVIIEFCLRSRQNAKLDKTSIWSEMATELRFALRLQDASLLTRHNHKALVKRQRDTNACDRRARGVTDSLLKSSHTASHSREQVQTPNKAHANVHHRNVNGRRLSAEI